MPSSNKNSSAGVNEDKSEGVGEASRIITMGRHHEDAQMNPNSHGGSHSGEDNSNSSFPSEQATKAAENTNSNANRRPRPKKAVDVDVDVVGRRRHLCSHCSTPGHRYSECPHRPCKHCNVMGHIGKDCPEIVEDRAQRRRAASRRYQAHLAM